LPDFTSLTRSEKPLPHPKILLRIAEVIEHQRHRRGGERVFHRGDHRQCRVELDMPVAALHARGGGEEALSRDFGIVDACG